MNHKLTVKTITVEYCAPRKLRAVADSPRIAAEILRREFSKLDSDVEHFAIICQDSRHRVIAFKILHTGTGIMCAVDSAKLFRIALKLGAVNFIVAHNHPSQDPLPSADDIKLTQSLDRGARLIGLQLSDHFIVTENGVYSIRANHSEIFTK